MKILKLPLKADPFESFLLGIKPTEYRKDGKWIHPRLVNPDGSLRKYDAVLFTNGYGNSQPWVLMEFKCARKTRIIENAVFSKELELPQEVGTWAIDIGIILDFGKLKANHHTCLLKRIWLDPTVESLCKKNGIETI